MLCDEGWGGPALGEVLGRSGSIARDAKAPRDRAACGVSAHACNDPCRAPAAALTPTQMPGPSRHREPWCCVVHVGRQRGSGPSATRVSPSGQATTRRSPDCLEGSCSGVVRLSPAHRGAASRHASRSSLWRGRVTIRRRQPSLHVACDGQPPPIHVRRCGSRRLRDNPPMAGPPLRSGPARSQLRLGVSVAVRRLARTPAGE